MSELWLHRYAVLLAVGTLFLVVAGAFVVSKDAGLSVPDWPLSYGQLMPEMKDGVFYEHGHRIVATAVGCMTIVLVIWVWGSRQPPWLKHLSLLALAAVILQGILGGLTVIYLLPKAVSITHACLAQLFFSATVAIAVLTSPSWKAGPQYVEDSGKPSLRFLAVASAFATLVQVALGAAYRHKALGIMSHVLWAAIVMLLVMMLGSFTISQFKSHEVLRQTSLWLLAGTGLQVVLGVAALTARVMASNHQASHSTMVLFTVAHTALGAVVMAAAVVMAIQVIRHVRSVRAVAPSHYAPGQVS